MKKLRLTILRNERESDHIGWVEACKKKQDVVDYSIVDLTSRDWLEQLKQTAADIFLLRPGSVSPLFKQLYDERVSILVNELDQFTYPSLNEILIYENKRYQSYWLKANDIPHPDTYIFYHKEEALGLLYHSDYPLVAKINTGSSGRGVEILHDQKQAREYVDSAFSKAGVGQKTGPSMSGGHYLQRAFRLLVQPALLKERLGTYRQRRMEKQSGFIIFQKFIPHSFEWRVVRIGDSFFAHQKLVRKGKASGSLKKGYENPPSPLLDFVKKITDDHEFRSVALDIFEVSPKKYLVNEIQCIFGQSDPFQMKVDGRAGRYIYTDRLIFEEGDFNQNESFDLRLEYLLENYPGKPAV